MGNSDHIEVTWAVESPGCGGLGVGWGFWVWSLRLAGTSLSRLGQLQSHPQGPGLAARPGFHFPTATDLSFATAVGGVGGVCVGEGWLKE